MEPTQRTIPRKNDCDGKVTLLNCELPAGNNIDFPTELKGAQAQEALKEAKASLAWAVLRTTGDENHVYLVVPASCAADSVCLADLSAVVCDTPNRKQTTVVRVSSVFCWVVLCVDCRVRSVYVSR